MTSDMMLNLTDRRYTALVRYAREANLNMLRSEGFSIRETENFYDRCDELGVMVTQQIFGRNIPDEALAVSCIEDMMLRIRNHPSLAHFLGHDETFPTPTLNKAYLEMIDRLRLHRTYQPHSGAFSVSERKQTGGTRTGTLELWTYAVPSHYYLRKNDGAWGFAQSGGIGGITVVRDSLRQMMPDVSALASPAIRRLVIPHGDARRPVLYGGQARDGAGLRRAQGYRRFLQQGLRDELQQRPRHV